MPTPALALLLALCTLTSSSAYAQGVGDLLVAPTRVVFEGRTRAVELALVNIGRATATYRISFIHQRMTEDGKFQEIKEPAEGELFCDDLVRFTPRQVVLEPRVTQVVRLQLRKPEALAAGEYRSHLLFRAIPQEPAAAPEEQAEPEGVGIRLIPIYGVSIAVIVRHGTSPSTVTLSDLQFQPSADDPTRGALTLRMNRSGAQSVYGDVSVAFTPHGEDKATTVGKALGVAVYTPNPSRLLTLPLQAPEGMSLRSGTLTVVYRQKPEDGGAILAEASVTVRLPASGDRLP